MVSKHSLTSAVNLCCAFGLHTVSFKMTFSFIIPSTYGTLHFIAPSVVKQRLTAQQVPSPISLIWHSFILISCPLLHIFVTFYIDGLWSTRFCQLCFFFFFLKSRENYLQGFPRATVHLMLWTGGMSLLVLLLMRASLRLPRRSIPYISSTSSSFFTFSFLLIFERETVALIFVNVNLSVAILEAVLFQKVILPVSSISYSFSFFVYFICEDVSLGT